MLAILQLLLAVFAIYSTLNFEEELKLSAPLGCLFVMLLISRIDKGMSDKESERKNYLKKEIDKILDKDATSVKEQDFFTIESLLWPKNEMLLVDAVHFIFKDLGFKITTGINYPSVDRIVKVPDTEKSFGIEVLMSGNETERRLPKVGRALQFERDKKNNEKTLIIASTHTRLSLSEREQMSDISTELEELLVDSSISFMTAYQLYQLWQKAKGGEIDIFKVFDEIYSHPGGVLSLKGMANSQSPSIDLAIPQTLPH